MNDTLFAQHPRLIVSAVLVAALAACAPLPFSLNAEAPAVPAGDVRISRVLIDEGMKRLREGRHEDASKIFNAGLKFVPDNAQLHFLNALTYHLQYLRGHEPSRELAATGYDTALSLDPAHYHAALQLGRLEYEARRYDTAIGAFQRAADIEPRSGEAHLGLAMAAYYASDLARARAAVVQSGLLLKESAAGAQAEAMVYAAVGEEAAARQAVARFDRIEPDPALRSRLTQRVDQWRAWHVVLAKTADAGTPPPTLLAQAGPIPYPTGSYPPGYAAPGNTAAAKEPALPRWTECDTPAGGTSYSPSAAGGGYSAPSSADETTALPALPVPCRGAGHPRMAILDVTIIRTEDSASSSYGVNLLNGLTYVFNRARTTVDTITTAGGRETRNIVFTRSRGDSLTNPSSAAGISYSLNIANAADARSEVLAQPSLVALDRQSSTFFSGRNITLGIAGQAGGASTFSDRPVGVSLSVTPTFIDDDTLLVSARAARSFVEQVDTNVSFGQTMQTSRNAVTANVVLRFGQTLILSGLAEQEVQRTSDGVPVLQDIPVLQYLFRNKTTQNFTRSVLVLITPRKPETERDELARQIKDRVPSGDAGREAMVNRIGERMRQGRDLVPNMSAAYAHALDNKLFLQFRSGDMRPDDWATRSRLDTFFKQLANTLYF